MRVTWQNAKALSTHELHELALKGVHASGFDDPDVYVEAQAALFELVQRALRGEVWGEELERRRNAV